MSDSSSDDDAVIVHSTDESSSNSDVGSIHSDSKSESDGDVIVHSTDDEEADESEVEDVKESPGENEQGKSRAAQSQVHATTRAKLHLKRKGGELKQRRERHAKTASKVAAVHRGNRTRREIAEEKRHAEALKKGKAIRLQMGIAQEENLPQEHIEGDQNEKEDGEREEKNGEEQEQQKQRHSTRPQPEAEAVSPQHSVHREALSKGKAMRRKLDEDHKKRHRAATIVQSRQRGKLARKKHAERKAHHHAKRKKHGGWGRYKDAQDTKTSCKKHTHTHIHIPY